MDLPLDRDPTATVTRDRHHPPHLKLNPTAEKDRGRTPRSQTDLTAIVARSSHDRGDFVVESSWNCLQLIGRRSTNDQDYDRGPIVAKIVAIWKQIEAKLTIDSSRN